MNDMFDEMYFMKFESTFICSPNGHISLNYSYSETNVNNRLEIIIVVCNECYTLRILILISTNWYCET